MDNNLVFPTYDEMHEMAVKLANLIKEKNVPFTKMVVVSRGGFVPASVVAYVLGIQDVDIVSIQSYVHREAVPPLSTISSITRTTSSVLGALCTIALPASLCT